MGEAIADRERTVADLPPEPVVADLDALLVQVAQGGRAAFARLYDLTSDRVFSLSRSITRDARIAEDVTQDVYLEIWRRAASFDPSRGSSLHWLLMLAHSRAIDSVRRTERAKERDARFQRLGSAPDFDAVSEHVLRESERAAVRTAVHGLPLAQQQALRLVYADGWTHVQASELAGVPLGTFKSRVRDALDTLRRRQSTTPNSLPR